MHRTSLLQFSCLALIALTPVAGATTAKPKAHKPAAASSSVVRSKSGRTGAGRNRGRSYVKATKTPPRPRGPVAPTPERYQEIQQALATKGYLKAQPNGQWDATSQDALRRFQADQKLEQTGKLNSLSLIALGLGPAKRGESQTPPSTQPQ